MDHNLPVTDVLPQLKTALIEHKAAVLIAPPGAGKTTAVPLALLDAPWLSDRKIILLEPRRLAARTAARRMAKSLGQEVGLTVGYRMRMDTKVSSATKIEIVTEGVFQRMILDDPELHGVACVIFDEFHERSLDADFGLALALDTCSALRDDLRLLIMSATLDGERVSDFIGGAPIVESLGRMFPVDICYIPRRADARIEDAMASAIRKALMEEEGSILAFLPGVAEIKRTAERLEGKLPDNAFIAPLFGAMDIADQDKAVQPTKNGMRKIVLATSLAESSITIDGVRIVIDSGLVRLPVFEASLGISRLTTKRASQASVIQRAGRAGRTAPGIAYRLWQEEQTAALAAFEQPEIMQSDLSSLLLDCAAWGVADPNSLAFLDAPPAAHLNEARKLLCGIDALDGEGRITDKGKKISAIGLEPRLAAMVVSGISKQDIERRAFLALLMGERGVGGNDVDLVQRFERAQRENTNRAKALKSMAKRMAENTQKSGDPDVSIGLMLCDAFPDRVARRRDHQSGSYVMANGRAVKIDDIHALAQHPFLIIADMAGSAAAARIVAAAPLSQEDFTGYFAHQIVEKTDIVFDKKTRKLRASKIRKLGAISLAAQTVPVMAGDGTTHVLLDALRHYGIDLLPWSKANSALRQRLAWLHMRAGVDWPDMSDEGLMNTCEDWLGPFLAGKTGFDALSETDLNNALMSRVDYALHSDIDRLAPSHFIVPTGSKIPLTYLVDGTPPVLSVRVQELFGLSVHPSVCDGTVPLSVEMLSPAHRPIQITQDLPGFWRGSWADMRSDMRGRYPRHEWPENPSQAAPTRRAKPRK